VSNKSRSRSKANPGWFPKGRSGNLKGRPTGSRYSKEVSALDIVLEKTLTVTDRGGTREITMEEALQQRTYQDALKGKRMAIREVLKWIQERKAWLANAAKPPLQEVTIGEAPDPDNADAALVLLGIAAPDQDRAWYNGRTLLLLEPWAVQAAMRRRRGGRRLTDQELEEIRRVTRDPDAPRWGTEK
jgi:Family of unknown function (DUF5681)